MYFLGQFPAKIMEFSFIIFFGKIVNPPKYVDVILVGDKQCFFPFCGKSFAKKKSYSKKHFFSIEKIFSLTKHQYSWAVLFFV